MPDSLFIFSLGPVQSFITQARKTQDLYTGSFMLSELARKAGHLLENQNRKIIYPRIKNRSLPNILVGHLKDTSLQDASKIMKNVEEKLMQQLIDWVSCIVNGSSNSNADIINQVTHLLETHWVVYPIEKSYQDAYQKVSSLLGSIKTHRRFEQFTERGLKCSICGLRNAIFYSDKRPPKNMTLDTRPIAVTSSIPITIKKNERLCTLCYMKREGKKFITNNYDSEFPSVAKVALMNILDHLEKYHQDLYKRYRQCFGEHFDWELLYESSLTKKYLEKNGYDIISYDDVKNTQEKIHTMLRNEGKVASNYYALLFFDGDDMGRWVSGKYLANIEDLEEFHVKLTESLGQFADSLDSLIKYPQGKLIYSGGDDIVALVNLQYLFSILTEIRRKFTEEFVMSDITKIKNKHIMTLSGAICIAHRMIPLSSVLEWTRFMESKAKNTTGKNSFTLGVMRRSGEIRCTVQKWNYEFDGRQVEILENIRTILHTLYEGVFSSTYLRHIINELESLNPIEKDPNENNMIQSEIHRLVSRSYTVEKKEDETDQEYKEKRLQNIDSVTSALIDFYSASEITNFISFLDICLFLSKEGAR